jgi:biotin carboxylase
MRRAFTKYIPKISPKYLVVKNYKKSTINQIINEIGLPCVIKPSNLSRSVLTLLCFFEDELEENLTNAYKKLRSIYKKNNSEREPTLLVEQFMEGHMYSIDAYVNSTGKLYYTPIIEIKTGRDMGADDFFMYTQITPSVLEKGEEIKAQYVVERATYALGLRSTTVHAELMKTQKGWKIIEVGSRPGGYRDELLGNGFGINHTVNDFFIHLGKKPYIPKKTKKHVCFIKFWPKKPGKLLKLKGLKKLKEMPWVIKTRQGKKVGDFAGLSKNGHTFVAGITLTGKTRSELLGNIRKVEKMIEIKTA